MHELLIYFITILLMAPPVVLSLIRFIVYRRKLFGLADVEKHVSQSSTFYRFGRSFFSFSMISIATFYVLSIYIYNLTQFFDYRVFFSPLLLVTLFSLYIYINSFCPAFYTKRSFYYYGFETFFRVKTFRVKDIESARFICCPFGYIVILKVISERDGLNNSYLFLFVDVAGIKKLELLLREK